MRRFVYKDEEHDVKVTVDIPEELFIQVKHGKQKLGDAIRRIAQHTLDLHKGEKPNESETR